MVVYHSFKYWTAKRSSTLVIKKFLDQHIRGISEGSRDTEDLNSAFQYHLLNLSSIQPLW